VTRWVWFGKKMEPTADNLLTSDTNYNMHDFVTPIIKRLK